MKNIINLSIIYFKQTLSSFFKSRKMKNNASSFLFAFFIFAIVFGAMGFSYYSSAQQLSEVGKTEYVLVFGLMYATFMVLMMTAYDAQNNYYKNKDYDMLASLPIENYSIITAKYLSSYFVSLFYAFIIAFPAYIVYFIFCPINFVSVLYSLLSIFFIPTFTQLIGSLLAYLINLLTFKIKNKTLVNNILTIIFTVGLVTFIAVANTNFTQSLFTSGVPLWIKIVFPHIYFLFGAITTGSFLQFLIFICITLAFACISIGLVSLGFKKINSGGISTTNKKTKRKIKIYYKKNSHISSLIKKETRAFFGSATYMINSIIGPILIVIIAIVLGTYAHNTSTIASSALSQIFISIYICFASMFASMCCPTSVSLSIEGQKLHLLKSLPLSTNTIFISKLLFSWILTVPFILVGDIIFLSLVPCSAGLVILTILTPLVSMFAFSGLGLLANLKWPKLNWTNETQAIKQGMSLFVTMMSCMAINLIPFLLVTLLYDKIIAVMSAELFLTIILAINILLVVTFYSVLFKKGSKMFYKIQ